MKTSNDSFEMIMKHLWGFVPLKIIAYSIRNNFFDILHENKNLNLEEISNLMKWHPTPANKLLNLFNNLSLVSENHIGYSLTELARKWFLKTSENYIGNFVLRAEELLYAYNDIDRILKLNKPSVKMYSLTQDSFGKNHKETHSFVYSMHSMSLEIINDILNKWSFKNDTRFFDIGCGLGTMCKYISLQYPNSKFDLLDLPGVTRYTKEYLLQNLSSAYNYIFLLVIGVILIIIPMKNMMLFSLAKYCTRKNILIKNYLLKNALKN